MGLEERVIALKLMDKTICLEANDESIWGKWIELGVPDGATEEDYYSIAEDIADFAEISCLFVNLIREIFIERKLR